MGLFHGKLTELGFKTYSDYLTSDHWSDFKESYRSSKLPQVCCVCGRKPVDLHHNNYQCLGRETFKDINPVCRQHHKAIHVWLKEKELPVWHTSEAIEFLRGQPRPAKKFGCSPNELFFLNHDSNEFAKRHNFSARQAFLLKLEAKKGIKKFSILFACYKKQLLKNKARKNLLAKDEATPLLKSNHEPAQPAQPEKPIVLPTAMQIETSKENLTNYQSQSVDDPLVAFKMIAIGRKIPRKPTDGKR